MASGTIVLLCLLAAGILMVAWVVWFVMAQEKTTRATQRSISDKALLEKISGQPDGFLSPATLSETTQLSKSEARVRLQRLASAGILDQAYNARMRMFYSLRHPLADTPAPTLSPEPFLTVDDVLTLFALHGGRPRDQDLIMSTGLPLQLIRREMKYFLDEGIVDRLYASEGYGKHSQRIYVLNEPYRSQPENFRRRAESDDLKLRTILRNDNFIV